jgi:hypothetical protein
MLIVGGNAGGWKRLTAGGWEKTVKSACVSYLLFIIYKDMSI